MEKFDAFRCFLLAIVFIVSSLLVTSAPVYSQKLENYSPAKLKSVSSKQSNQEAIGKKILEVIKSDRNREKAAVVPPADADVLKVLKTQKPPKETTNINQKNREKNEQTFQDINDEQTQSIRRNYAKFLKRRKKSKIKGEQPDYSAYNRKFKPIVRKSTQSQTIAEE